MTGMKALMAVIGCCAAVAAQPALAMDGRVGAVKACSEVNSDKCATGTIRNTAYGKEVQLPGGTWVDCAGDCREKLRKKTVDFWHEQMLRN